ncbi:hypothetical protein GTW51_21940 [Aurantimonas aggregata]|uniref:DUF305 domain-containing protein n=1 Tax=Aurantimonas aggregata TaxID=2047720 RepID=A0A6L9MPE5_9HYPH|nr:hypothetical protein [Aurantimonas aggregata]NDV89328.1 hypothetical protein [Aurantimonas aggregata]
MYKMWNVVAALLLAGTSVAVAREKTETPGHHPMMHFAGTMSGDMQGSMSEMMEHCNRMMKAVATQDAAPEVGLQQDS